MIINSQFFFGLYALTFRTVLPTVPLLALTDTMLALPSPTAGIHTPHAPAILSGIAILAYAGSIGTTSFSQAVTWTAEFVAADTRVWLLAQALAILTVPMRAAFLWTQQVCAPLAGVVWLTYTDSLYTGAPP